MNSVREVEVLPTGLAGDRYALGKGAWSKGKRVVVRHVSLIAVEAIQEANDIGPSIFTVEDTRRNILTEGVDLNALVGKSFKVGRVTLNGVELCDPCNRPSVISKRTGFEDQFAGRGGLRAEVRSTGIISLGDGVFEITT
jgi:MOSC domain-containing protein YiiM